MTAEQHAFSTGKRRRTDGPQTGAAQAHREVHRAAGGQPAPGERLAGLEALAMEAEPHALARHAHLGLHEHLEPEQVPAWSLPSPSLGLLGPLPVLCWVTA